MIIIRFDFRECCTRPRILTHADDALPMGLTRFLDDGRIEIDSNVVERVIRPIALNRKNALFAGSDGGGEHWAIIASLIETCKLGGIDPQTYLADVITRIVNGHLNSQIDELLPWAYVTPADLKAVA
jgi:transposase